MAHHIFYLQLIHQLKCKYKYIYTPICYMYFSNASGRYSTSDFRVGTFSPQLIRRPKMKRSLVNNLFFKNQFFFSVTSKKPKFWVRIGTLKSVTYVFKKKHHRKNFKSFFLVFYPQVFSATFIHEINFFVENFTLNM